VSTATRQRLANLLARLDPDLAEANLLIACEAYPNLDVARWLGRVQALADEARAAGGRADDVIATLRGTDIRGDRATYDDPRNSFLHEVLDRRVGLPIALAALTVAVATRTGVDIRPVGMPGHVIVVDMSADAPRFLDPFDDWTDRTVDECRDIVRATAGVRLVPEHLEPSTPRFIVRRMLINLTGSYLRRELIADARWTVELQAIVDPDDPSVAEQLRAFDGLDDQV
jgi:regulator of sirC expression with transglutaminase-like and TPR domain